MYRGLHVYMHSCNSVKITWLSNKYHTMVTINKLNTMAIITVQLLRNNNVYIIII